MEKNYMNAQFLNYEAYEELIACIGKKTQDPDPDVAEEAQEDLEFLRKNVNNCLDYVHTVDTAETRIKTARFRYEAAEYQDIVMNLDRARRVMHEGAIASVAIINRTARIYGTPKIFIGNAEDRLQIADFCLEISVEIFDRRSK